MPRLGCERPVQLCPYSERLTSCADLLCGTGNLAVSKPVWWLQTRMHFAFADYYNPDNIRFGALRVLNDDLVAPGGDFGCAPPPPPTHAQPHACCSYVAQPWQPSSAKRRCPMSHPLSSCHARKHLHRDAEIFTYVLQGELSHRKAGAAWEALARGSVQYFSAGTGTHHEVAAAVTSCPPPPFTHRHKHTQTRTPYDRTDDKPVCPPIYMLKP